MNRLAMPSRYAACRVIPIRVLRDSPQDVTFVGIRSVSRVEVDVGPSESDLNRLLAGEAPADDPGLDDVVVFLADLRQAYPPAPVEHVHDAHLAAIAHEARRLTAPPAHPRRRRTRRVVVTAVASALSILTAGVGVATAMGGNPLAFLPGLRVGPPAVPGSAKPIRADPGPATSGPPASADGDPRIPSAAPGRTKTADPASEQTGRAGGESGHGRSEQAKANHGRSEEAKADHGRPSAKPSRPNKGKADPPAKGRSGEAPPSSNGNRAPR